jgi:flagellar biosynthesis GTPase FlhF
MHWHWITSHLLTVLAYGYEVIGGILIFYSSAVTETSMPEDRRRKGHWIMFGVVALVYIAFGIGLRRVELQQNEQTSQRADQDRKELRENRNRVDSRMDSVLSSFQVTYSQLASVSSELGTMRNSLLQAIHKNDPRQIADLESKAQAAQQQVDTLSHELLALTMAPQIVEQLRDWQIELDAREQDLHNEEWEEQVHYMHDHQDDFTQGVKEINDRWDIRYRQKEEEFKAKLKGLVGTADFIRGELLQKLPPNWVSPEDRRQEQEFAKAKSDPGPLDQQRRGALASYLENLAKRVPPPK